MAKRSGGEVIAQDSPSLFLLPPPHPARLLNLSSAALPALSLLSSTSSSSPNLSFSHTRSASTSFSVCVSSLGSADAAGSHASKSGEDSKVATSLLRRELRVLKSLPLRVEQGERSATGRREERQVQTYCSPKLL